MTHAKERRDIIIPFFLLFFQLKALHSELYEVNEKASVSALKYFEKKRGGRANMKVLT
jgi:hypothetical protein